MSDKEYMDAIESFFNDRLKSQIRKKYTHCEGCEQVKQFTIKKDKLVYSCGAKSGKCGPQVIIKLPKYLYYPEANQDIHKILNYHLDKRKFKDIFTVEEIQDQEEIIHDNEKLLKKIQKVFMELNQFKEREKQIKQNHKQRIELKKEQCILLEKIHKEDNPDKQHKLRVQYLEYNQLIKDHYLELIDANKDIHNFITIEPGDVLSKVKK
jgi:hypothetical protein